MRNDSADSLAPAAIELRIDQIGHLFETLDPFPVHARDLSRAAEEYIVSWARELPRNATFRIVVHVPQSALGASEARLLQDAFQRYFSDRAEVALREVRDLFRIGRLSALIGLGALAASVAGGQIVSATLGTGPVGRFLTEGLFILGWVANWRPVEIFLYDWWPIVQRRRLYRRLAAAPVEVNAI
jgi:hypothetical protein